MVTTGVGLHKTILSRFYRRCYIAGEIRRRNGSRAPLGYIDRPALLESPQMVRGKKCNHNNVLEVLHHTGWNSCGRFAYTYSGGRIAGKVGVFYSQSPVGVTDRSALSQSQMASS